MQEVSSLVGQYGGTIDKYMGDSVMAFWDSKDDTCHAQQAVDAAIAIELHFNKADSVINQHSQPLDYGIGINSGTAMVGQMGTKDRASYTVMGDVVNVASRLEALSSTMGCRIIIGSETVEQLENIVCKSLGEVNLRGRKNSVSIYTPTMPINNIG
jgi:adenylate cyclase